MSEEEDFHRALRKARPLDTLKTWAPIFGGGVVGLAALLAVYFVWPLPTIPVIVLFGVPVIAGGAAVVGLQKAFGVKR